MYQQQYSQQNYYDPSSYNPYPSQSPNMGGGGGGPQQRHQAHSPPPLQHPIPTHPIPSFDAPSPQPPQGPQAGGQGQPQGMPYLYQNFGFNDPAAQMGMQFGVGAIKKGSEYVEQNINRWVNIPALKHYFKVNNLYVVNKIRLLLFPWRHKPWTRMVKRSENGQTEGFRPPREDINSPDLYIPAMAVVTYVLLVGIVTGRESKFHPEVLGMTASTALAVVLFELVFIRLGCYLLSITSEAAMLDLVAYAGYKFVGIVVAELAKMSYAPGWVVWGAFLYASMSIGFFLLRSLRYVVLPDSGTSTVLNPQRKRRVWFLFMIAGMQLVFMFFLV